jgi:hypothetical protein
VAVRKRIIRILRDIIDRHPDYEKAPEIIAKIVRRIADEEGVRKLVVETLFSLWFTTTRDEEVMNSRIVLMADAVSEMIGLGYVEHLKQAITAVLKDYAERSQLEEACRQMVDALVDKVLQLDQEIANAEANGVFAGNADNNDEDDESPNDAINTKRIMQQRLVASLTALSVFSNVNPSLLIRHAEVMVPYLAIKPSSPTESQVLVAVSFHLNIEAVLIPTLF